MNNGLMMARSIAWNAVTKVRSSVVWRPRMMVWAKTPNTPAMSPVVMVAASSDATCALLRLMARYPTFQTPVAAVSRA